MNLDETGKARRRFYIASLFSFLDFHSLVVRTLVEGFIVSWWSVPTCWDIHLLFFVFVNNL